jgi:hypothetical protein
MTMMLQESVPHHRGRTRKFTPENIQKIKDFVAQGFNREKIAELLDVTVGSLQVTCSRLGISLRTRQYPNGGARWIGAVGRPHIANSPPMVRQPSANSQFQITLEGNGVRNATDISLTDLDIAHIGLEAAVRDLSMAQLLSAVVTTAIQENMIEDILREPTQSPAPQAVLESAVIAPPIDPLS